MQVFKYLYSSICTTSLDLSFSFSSFIPFNSSISSFTLYGNCSISSFNFFIVLSLISLKSAISYSFVEMLSITSFLSLISDFKFSTISALLSSIFLNTSLYALLVESIVINPITYKLFNVPYNNYKVYNKQISV